MPKGPRNCPQQQQSFYMQGSTPRVPTTALSDKHCGKQYSSKGLQHGPYKAPNKGMGIRRQTCTSWVLRMRNTQLGNPQRPNGTLPLFCPQNPIKRICHHRTEYILQSIAHGFGVGRYSNTSLPKWCVRGVRLICSRVRVVSEVLGDAAGPRSPGLTR